MSQKPSDLTPEIPPDTDERPERFPGQEPPDQANDQPGFQDDDVERENEIDDEDVEPGPDGEP